MANPLLKNTLQLLRAHKIRLHKRLGQTLLVDPLYIRREVEYAKLKKEDVVLEIGPGTGNITDEIAPHVREVICIELDERFKGILEEKKEKHGDITLIFDDAVKCEFPYFNKVISNIPYYVSSALTFKILRYKFEFAVLTYQEEFARRLIAEPGGADYGRLTVNAKVRAEVDFLEKIPKNAFFPVPDVDSAIVMVKPRESLPIRSAIEKFQKVVDGIFPYRNKKARTATSHFLNILKVGKVTREKILEKLPYSDYRVKDLNIKMIDKITMHIYGFLEG